MPGIKIRSSERRLLISLATAIGLGGCSSLSADRPIGAGEGGTTGYPVSPCACVELPANPPDIELWRRLGVESPANG